MVRWLAGFDELRKQKDIYLKLAMESRFVSVGKPATLAFEVKDAKKQLSKFLLCVKIDNLLKSANSVMSYPC